MSNRAIAKLFKMSPNNGHNVVKEVIENALVENPDSGKSTTPEVSTSAATHDGPYPCAMCPI